MKIEVDVDAWSRETHREPEEFGEWSAEGGIDGVSVRRAKADADLRRRDVFDVDAKVGDHVFVVVAHYGSGDSFGHQSGGEYQIVGAYTTVEKADECKQICDLYTEDKVKYADFARKQQGLSRSKSNVALPLVIDGKQVYVYWEGWATSLNEIKIWTCKIRA